MLSYTTELQATTTAPYMDVSKCTLTCLVFGEKQSSCFNKSYTTTQDKYRISRLAGLCNILLYCLNKALHAFFFLSPIVICLMVPKFIASSTWSALLRLYFVLQNE